MCGPWERGDVVDGSTHHNIGALRSLCLGRGEAGGVLEGPGSGKEGVSKQAESVHSSMKRPGVIPANKGWLWPLQEALWSRPKGLQGLVKGEEEVTGKLQGGVKEFCFSEARIIGYFGKRMVSCGRYQRRYWG